MTGLDYLFIALLIVGSSLGAVKGLIKTVFGLVSTLLVIGVAYTLYPVVSQILFRSTGLYPFLTGKISEALDLESLGNGLWSQQERQSQIDALDIPGFLQKLLIQNDNREVHRLLELSTDGLSDYVSSFLATLMIQGIAFILVLIIAGVVVAVLVRALNIISKLPVVKQLNHVGGLIAGIVLSLLGLFVLAMVLLVISGFQSQPDLQVLLSKSVVVQLFYQDYGFLRGLFDITKTWLNR